MFVKGAPPRLLLRGVPQFRYLAGVAAASPMYQFHFDQTARDALDAYDALRTTQTRMRPFFRFLMAMYGLFFFVGFAAAATNPIGVRWWQWVIWLAMGGGITWLYVVKPAVIRRRLRKATNQPIWVEISDNGISARVGSEESVHRYWGEFTGIIAVKKGLALGFRDGTISWLPQRAMAHLASREELESYVKSKLPQEDTSD